MQSALMVLLALVVLAVGMAVGALLLLRRRSAERTRRNAGQGDGETVYSTLGEGDTEVLDMDPVHEAEIYLAYGNKEMALKVLRKAAAAAPQRVDIQKKIEELLAE